jgi:hypothetical protein
MLEISQTDVHGLVSSSCHDCLVLKATTFDAEFVAMKNGMEGIRGLRYKLRMMGIPLVGAAYIYGDNMSVIHNTQ